MTVTVPSGAIAAVAPAMLLNSVGTRAVAFCAVAATGAGAGAGDGGGLGGGGGGGSSLAAGVGTSLPPLCVPTNIVLPSGANVTVQTLDFAASGPSCSPLAFTSQSFTAPSRLPVASRVPSGEKEALVTQSLWPESVANSFESEVFQSLIVRSAPAVASFEPSGE